MKKNKQYRAKKATIRNAKRAMKDKKRSYPRVIQDTPKGAKYVRMHKPKEIVKVFEHGPSNLITKDKDGKLTFKNMSAHTHRVDYLTETGKAAIVENKRISTAKRELIKSILNKAGYDPTIRYTRKEKRKFTRAVKENLFKTEVMKPLPNIKGKQRPVSVEELIDIRDNEKPNKRKFTYIINRVKEADMKLKEEGKPYRNYDFLTDYFEEETIKKAEKKLGQIAKKWAKEDSFAGITLKDPDGENLTKYYTVDLLKKLAA